MSSRADIDSDEPQGPDDTYIVSDLHLSAGRLGDERTFRRLESFFYDGQFSRFVDAVLADHRRRGRGLRRSPSRHSMPS